MTQWRDTWTRKRDRRKEPVTVAATLAEQETVAANELTQAGYSPDAFVHVPTRARVLSRLDLASYAAQATGQFSSMIQAEVKIGEHLGMFNDRSRADEVTLALVDTLREALNGQRRELPKPKVIDAIPALPDVTQRNP